ncbi:MAG: DEAD/DEAH box helicase family protein [bacterium]|nr:DEAD/DEAH box helicase family protein [bacterium]
MLEASGWAVQDSQSVALGASLGVAVREYPMAKGHGFADYLLFVDRHPVGVVEAKKPGVPLTGVEFQSKKYTEGLPAELDAIARPLRFAYESTGRPETRFTNGLDPEPRSRRVFTFHRPETLLDQLHRWVDDPTQATLNQRLLGQLPVLELDTSNLWAAQERAIRNLDDSLRAYKPRALIQMATGSGKTYTAANISYRLTKYAGARRILFLVDRSNLGRQTLKEFQQFETPDDGRKFTELYNVQHLGTNTLDPVAKVTITTIQRLYSILRGDAEFDSTLEEETGFDVEPSRPVEISYNPDVPIEFFDVIVVDECHRSIYGVWRQVLEYFDAYLVGLTATPGKQTFGFFHQNLVMEYAREHAVADGVNVDFDVYRIQTEITEKGSTVDAGFYGKFRDRETRAVRMEMLDEDFDYEASKVGTDVVAVDQIRTIVRTFRDKLPEIFPGRTEVPKTLVFAKTDAHADDIVQIIREEFGKGNDFAVKITSKTTGAKPEDLLASFRNSYNPRIAVTVDMIATGTDVKPLECLLFMRMVKSRNYFEQMKGRGVRIVNPDDLQAVTPDALVKDRFVIVDAVGATETELNETVPLERKRTVPFEKLLNRLATGGYDIDDVSSIASRLSRLNSQLTAEEHARVAEIAGTTLETIIHGLVDAVDPDRHQQAAQEESGLDQPSGEAVEAAAKQLLAEAVIPLADNPALRQELQSIRSVHEQFIDEISVDHVTEAGYSAAATDRARKTIESWKAFIREHRDDITALQVLYDQPWGAQDLTFTELKGLAQVIERPPHSWTPEKLWAAYEALDESTVQGSDQRVLTDLVSLVHRALDPDEDLIPFPDLVEDRYQAWLAEQAAAGITYTAEQRAWLDRIKDHIAASLQIAPDDLTLPGFSEHGGLGAAHQALGDNINDILTDLNKALVG